MCQLGHLKDLGAGDKVLKPARAGYGVGSEDWQTCPPVFMQTRQRGWGEEDHPRRYRGMGSGPGRLRGRDCRSLDRKRETGVAGREPRAARLGNTLVSRELSPVPTACAGASSGELSWAFHGARGQVHRGAEEDVLQSLEPLTASQGFGLLGKGTKYLRSVSGWSEVGSAASAPHPHTPPTPTARGRGLCRVTAAFPPSSDVGCPSLQLLPKSLFSPLVHLCFQLRTPSGAVTPRRPS